jgi:hypothetical protein
MKSVTAGLLFVLAILWACSCHDKNTQPRGSLHRNSKFDSLLRHEHFEAARIYATKQLQMRGNDNLADKANLYAVIGTSYATSYYKDSSRKYFEIAFALSKETEDTTLMAIIGADLLMQYIKSYAFQQQQDSLLKELTNLCMANLTDNTKLRVLNAVIACYSANDRQGMCLFTLAQAMPFCEKLMTSKSLHYLDSASIENYFLYQGICHSRMNDAGRDSGLESFKKSRKWVCNTSRTKAQYYRFTIVGLTDIESSKDINTAVNYIDSLTDLANASGQNFDDLLLISFINLSDYFYYYKKDYRTSWKYHMQAEKYLRHNSNQIFEVWYKWQEGDLYRQQSMFKEAILSFMSIAKYIKKPFNFQRLKIANTIADCYSQMGLPDSAIAYYKKIAPLETSEFRELEKKIREEADAKYIDEIKQRKINEQLATIQHTQNQKLFLIAGLGMASALTVLLFVIYSNKRKSAQKLNIQNIQLYDLNMRLNEANDTKSKLFGIISHDLRAPVSQLYELLKLQRSANYALITAEEKKKLEQETDATTITLLDTMEELLIWSKTQMNSFHVNNTLVDIKKVFRQFSLIVWLKRMSISCLPSSEIYCKMPLKHHRKRELSPLPTNPTFA